MKLPEVKKAIEKKFEEALASPYAFDYFGLERGGHHAVLHWVLALTGKPNMHIAQAHGKHPICLRYHPSGWFTSHIEPPKGVALAYRPDQDIEAAPSRIGQKRIILCVRDIKNILASRIRWYNNGFNSDVGPVFTVDGATTDLWKKYAKQTLGDKDYFNGNCVAILFDKWATDQDYRKKIITTLKTKFNWELLDNPDTGIGEVAKAGGGSSFDGLDFDQKAQQMKVTERWKEYEKHPLVQKLLTPEILDLNNRLKEV